MRQLLSDIAKIGAGQGAPQGDSNYCDYGIPFVKAGNLQDLTTGGSLDEIQKVSEEVAKKYKLKLYPKGTVLFAKSGMSCLKGYVYVLPQDAYVVSHLACITPIDDISDYLRYYFFFHKPNQLVKDAAYPSISLADIGSLEIDIKDEENRKKIIIILRTIESIIALRHQELQAMDYLIKARFVEMFGNYEIETSLSQVATVTGGLTKNSKRNTMPLRLPYLRVANVSFNKIDTSDMLEIGLTEKEMAKTLLQHGDLLFVEGNGSPDQIGKVAVWKDEITPCVHQNHLIKARFNETILPIFAMYYYMTENGRQQIRAKAVSTSGLYTLSIKKVEDLQIPLPPIQLQKEFAAFVAQVDKSKVI